MLSISELLWKLPLFDDVYYSMQGQNVMLVDIYLRDIEANVLREYHQQERTPVPDMMFLSAISQMWIFSVYELLRTWRQAVRYIKAQAGRPAQVASQGSGNTIDLATAVREANIEKARIDPGFVQSLDEAWDKIEPVFRSIEALRMNLAKHEVKGRKNHPAAGPGYARLDESTGSLVWMVDLGDYNVDMVNRRDFADDLRMAVIGNLLPGDHPMEDEDLEE